jgi:fucose 4-O-acetylase-like acetyltransferase
MRFGGHRRAMPELARVLGCEMANAALSGGSRVAWIDYAKAFGITLVVLGHVNSGLLKTPDLVMSDGLKLINTFLYSFHMPLFFVLAGFVVFLRKKGTLREVVRDAVLAVAVPYLVWSVLWIVAKANMADWTENDVTLTRIATILWEPIGHMWFLFHLFAIRLLWLAVERSVPFNGQVGVCVAAILASIGLVTLGAEWVMSWYFVQNFAFFGFGMLVLPNLTMPKTRLRSLALGVLSLLAWAVAYPVINVFNGPVTGFFLGMIGTFMVVLIARSLPDPSTIGFRVLAFVGEASLAIYVMHLFLVSGLRKVLTLAGHWNEMTALIIVTPLGVMIPALIYWCILRSSAIAGTPLARYVGLGLAQNSRYLDFGTKTRSTPAAATAT